MVSGAISPEWKYEAWRCIFEVHVSPAVISELLSSLLTSPGIASCTELYSSHGLRDQLHGYMLPGECEVRWICEEGGVGVFLGWAPGRMYRCLWARSDRLVCGTMGISYITYCSLLQDSSAGMALGFPVLGFTHMSSCSLEARCVPAAQGIGQVRSQAWIHLFSLTALSTTPVAFPIRSGR